MVPSFPIFSPVIASLLFFTASTLVAQTNDEKLALITALSSDQNWVQLERTPLQFPVYHPQGMTRVGNFFFMSSVETIARPQALTDNDRYDRTPGAGIGHLFKFNIDGELIAQTTLGENTIYHPGGIDFDGESIWVSVAEYRPDSHSIVYRVDPESLIATEVLRFDDHLGAIARDAQNGNLYGASWGSRRLYEWSSSAAGYSNQSVRQVNKVGSDIDYQDCQILLAGRMLCSGIGSMEIDNTHRLTIGGLELVNLDNLEVLHKIRVTGNTETREFLTRNPFYFEMTPQGRGLFYFVPEDDTAALYLYSAAVQ